MGCGTNKSCCTGECAGSCNNSNTNGNDVSLDTIVELEIYYSELSEAKTEAYIFKSLYYLTNIQRKELKITGLEGNRYNSLDMMKSEVVDSLTMHKDVDVLYIRDDV